MKFRDLIVNNVEDIFVLVKDIKEKKTKTNSCYIELELFDGDSSINAKIWNKTIDEINFQSGNIIKIRGTVNEWNESKQIVIERYRLKENSDEVDESDFIKTSPINGIEVFDDIIRIIDNFKNENLKNITSELLNDFKEELLYYPGAQKVHHAERLGLLYHTYRMLLSATKLPSVYTSLNKDLLYAGIILHDIGKVSEIKADKSCNVIEYSNNGILLGHITEGVKFIERKAIKLGIEDSEEVMLLEHIIVSHHGEFEYGAIKKPMFKEAQVIHFLDNMDSKLYMMEEDTKNIQQGDFSDKNYFLGRQIYKS